MIIREYDPQTDAASLAEHFRRSSYGPHHGSVALERSSMEAVLAERVPELFMVAVDGTNIVGCIGFMRGSGRRVTRKGELFAGLFVLDPRHRNSMLAGNLFMKSFEVLVDRGIRALRIEATPTNTKAYPLYLRAGFRTIPGLRSDEDGYVELVSHLPGVVSDILQGSVEEAPAVMPRFTWRNAGSGRSIKPNTGVTVSDTGPIVSYDLNAGDLHLRADVDLTTGATREYKTIAGDLAPLPRHGGLDRTATARTACKRDLGQGVRAEVDTHGTLRLRVDGTPGSILVDHWPVIRTHNASGWRRPNPVDVQISCDDQGWNLWAEGQGGRITRRVGLGIGKITVTTQATDAAENAELLISPWVTMRQAEKYVESAEGKWVGGPVVRGIWPLDYTDFEACADEDPAMASMVRSLWHNSSATLEAVWNTGATARHEGNHMPQLRQRADRTLRYEVTVTGQSGLASVPGTFTCPVGLSIEKVWRQTPKLSKKRLPSGVPNWKPAKRYGADVVESVAGSRSLRYSQAAVGVVSWSDGRSQILTAPYPAVRVWGALPDWSAGLWAAVVTNREDPEQGVEWAGKSDALPMSPHEGGNQPVWWNIQTPDDTSAGIEVHGYASQTVEPTELGFYLTPAVSTGAPVLIARPDGGSWVIEATNDPWSTGCHALAAELQDGRYLVVRRLEGEHQEIFVRSEARGLHLSLLTRVSSGHPHSAWGLDIVEHRSAALKAMTP